MNVRFTDLDENSQIRTDPLKFLVEHEHTNNKKYLDIYLDKR